MYYLYLLGIFLARALPIQVGYVVAIAVSRVYYFFARNDKLALRHNLRVVLGEGASEKTINKLVRRIFINFAKYLADFFKYTRISEGFIEKMVEIKGEEHIKDALSNGKGAVLLALHIGNWELGGFVVGSLGYPFNSLVLDHEDQRINKFFKRQREVNGAKTIPLGAAVKQCFRVLRGNELLAIVGDKNYTGNGVYVDFFGKKALLPKGAAVFSLKTGSPIIVTVMTRKKGNTFQLKMEKPIHPVPTGDMEKDVKALMGEYIKVFERTIKAHPEQWYVFKNIWEQ